MGLCRGGLHSKISIHRFSRLAVGGTGGGDGGASGSIGDGGVEDSFVDFSGASGLDDDDDDDDKLTHVSGVRLLIALHMQPD